MKTAIEKFTYGGSDIDFDLSVEEFLINGTKMANIFNKRTNDFLNLDQTKSFIEALSRSGNLRYEQIVRVAQGGRNQGTWMHRKLALKFASWLSADFELWVYDVIEKIMFGEAQVLRNNNDELRVIINRINEIDKEYSIIGKERYQLAKRQKELLATNIGLLNDN